MNNKFLPIIALFTLILLLSGCSNSSSEQGFRGDSLEEVTETEMVERYTRIDSQGDVLVELVWATPELYEKLGKQELVDEYELEKYIVFDLSLSTHSGNLMDFPYQDNIYLLTDTSQISPESITIRSRDSHHPRMLLKFSVAEFVNVESKSFELVIKNLRDIPERSFVWQNTST